MDMGTVAYTAGFIDGEGTITANYRMSARGFPALHYRVLIANTDLTALERLQKEWGGRLSLYGKKRSEKHKQVYGIYWGGDTCLPLIEAILPFLRIKKRQAEIVLLLSKLKSHYEKGKQGRFVSDEVKQARVSLVEEMVKLNHRGMNNPDTHLGRKPALP